MRLLGEKDNSPEKINRNAQHSDKIIGLLVTNFVQIGVMMCRMVFHLVTMGYHGLNNALKNRTKNKNKPTDD